MWGHISAMLFVSTPCLAHWDSGPHFEETQNWCKFCCINCCSKQQCTLVNKFGYVSLKKNSCVWWYSGRSRDMPTCRVNIIEPAAILDIIVRFYMPQTLSHHHQIWHRWSPEKASQRFFFFVLILKTIFSAPAYWNRQQNCQAGCELISQPVFDQLT